MMLYEAAGLRLCSKEVLHYGGGIQIAIPLAYVEHHPVTQLCKPAKIHKAVVCSVYLSAVLHQQALSRRAVSALLKSRQGILVLDRSHVHVISVLCLCAGKCMLTRAKLKEMWCLFSDGEFTPRVT